MFTHQYLQTDCEHPMKNHLFLRLPLLLLASAAIFIGCDCGTEPGEPLIHTPGSGSMFMFSNHQTDSLGNTIPATQTQTTRTILNTNATIAGKSGVVQFLEAGDTISMKYEANGDVQLLQPATTYPNAAFPAPAGLALPNVTVPARWLLFGLGSKTPQTVPGYDTTVSVSMSGLPLPIVVTVNATGNTAYIGTEDLVIAGETIPTQKALLTVNANFSAALLFSGSTTTVDTVWFAPKLGMFIRDEAKTSAQLPPQFGTSGPMGGKASVMTGYTMK
jgi:hypothetical protein